MNLNRAIKSHYSNQKVLLSQLISSLDYKQLILENCSIEIDVS
ncbi:hypothetical protein [Mycoplasma sp. 3686d]|nr:hypothetical protein [Mycoplasma sp. 3686d]UUM24539.1 hypothetical protein NPA12_02455 [Mycoplasma sp. 3686d]